MLLRHLLARALCFAPDDLGDGVGVSAAAIGQAFDQAVNQETDDEPSNQTEPRTPEGSTHQTGDDAGTQSKNDETPLTKAEVAEQLKALGPDHPLVQQMSKYAHERKALAEENARLKAEATTREVNSATQAAPQIQPNRETPGQPGTYPELNGLNRFEDEYGNKVVQMPDGRVMLEEHAAQEIRLANTNARLDRFEKAQQQAQLTQEVNKIATSMTTMADKAIAEAFPMDLGQFKGLTQRQVLQMAAQISSPKGEFDPSLMEKSIPEAAKALAFAYGEIGNLQIKHNAEAAAKQPVTKGGKAPLVDGTNPWKDKNALSVRVADSIG
jgi:hypothetical protein